MRLQSYDFFRQYQQKKIEKCIFRREFAYAAAPQKVDTERWKTDGK